MENAIVTAETKAMAMVPTGNEMYFDPVKFEHAQRVATMLSKTDMVPDHFKGKVGNCMIALNYSTRIGADPFMVMQKMYVVHGKPGIESQLAISLLNNSERFEPVEYEAKGDLVKPTNMEDGCRAFAKEIKSGKVLFGPWITWQMVKAEGWYGKKGSKWQTIPTLMFRYRAAAYFIKTYCPEVTMGMNTREELNDMKEVTARVVEGDAPQTTTEKVKAALSAKVEDEPNKAPETGTYTESTEVVVESDQGDLFGNEGEEPAPGDGGAPEKEGCLTVDQQTEVEGLAKDAGVHHMTLKKYLKDALNIESGDLIDVKSENYEVIKMWISSQDKAE